MGLNAGAGKLLEAYHRMSESAAGLILAAAQMYAERHPKPVEEDHFRVDTANSYENVQMIGDASPCGMCVIRWSDRRITWSNNAYRQHFVDLSLREANTGRRIDDVLPGFVESGLETIFERVAATGEPFHANDYLLLLPNGLATLWDWSLSVLPTAAGDDIALLVQMHRVPHASAPPAMAS